ncbi:MAG: PPOX class F420-dependent oxidoreductase [Halobacteriaceae archaeon]
MASIPDAFVDLLERETFAHVATLAPDGRPHVTPVWIDHDGDDVLFNTAEGRVKTRNVRADERVALSVTDPDDPYRYLAIRGDVVEVTTEGADDHIDELARRYMGVDEYPNHQPGVDRIIVRVRPTAVSTRANPND